MAGAPGLQQRAQIDAVHLSVAVEVARTVRGTRTPFREEEAQVGSGHHAVTVEVGGAVVLALVAGVPIEILCGPRAGRPLAKGRRGCRCNRSGREALRSRVRPSPGCEDSLKANTLEPLPQQDATASSSRSSLRRPTPAGKVSDRRISSPIRLWGSIERWRHRTRTSFTVPAACRRRRSPCGRRRGPGRPRSRSPLRAPGRGSAPPGRRPRHRARA